MGAAPEWLTVQRSIYEHGRLYLCEERTAPVMMALKVRWNGTANSQLKRF